MRAINKTFRRLSVYSESCRYRELFAVLRERRVHPVVLVGLGLWLHVRIRCFIRHGDECWLPTGEHGSPDKTAPARDESCGTRAATHDSSNREVWLGPRGCNQPASVEQIEPTHTFSYAAANRTSTAGVRSWWSGPSLSPGRRSPRPRLADGSASEAQSGASDRSMARFRRFGPSLDRRGSVRRR